MFSVCVVIIIKEESKMGAMFVGTRRNKCFKMYGKGNKMEFYNVLF